MICITWAGTSIFFSGVPEATMQYTHLGDSFFSWTMFSNQRLSKLDTLHCPYILWNISDIVHEHWHSHSQQSKCFFPGCPGGQAAKERYQGLNFSSSSRPFLDIPVCLFFLFSLPKSFLSLSTVSQKNTLHKRTKDSFFHRKYICCVWVSHCCCSLSLYLILLCFPSITATISTRPMQKY